jgi:hypothetical protein
MIALPTESACGSLPVRRAVQVMLTPVVVVVSALSAGTLLACSFWSPPGRMGIHAIFGGFVARHDEWCAILK